MEEKIEGHPNLRNMSTEQARATGQAGGQVKSVPKSLINRRFCAPKCPLWETCWARNLSLESPEYKDGKKCLCALKTMPLRTQKRALRLIKEGEAGFNNELMEMFLRYGNKIDKDNTKRDQENYFKYGIEIKKAVYGDKSRIDHNMNSGTLTIDILNKQYEEVLKKAAEDAKSEEKK